MLQKMNNEFQKMDRSKPLFTFEDYDEDYDFIKSEPVINEELEITPVIDFDAVKTEQDEPNQNEKNDLDFPIESQFNFPIEIQANVLKTYSRNKAKITKHYTSSTSKNSDNLTVPELIENSIPNETQPVEIKIETIEQINVTEHLTFEPIAEVEVKENIIFEPFKELNIKEIVKTEENVVKQPLGIEDVTDNLVNGKKDKAQNVVDSSTTIVIEDTNKISCMYCAVKVKDLFQLDIHTHKLHNKSPFAKHMPKTAQKRGRKRLKHTCIFCDKKFTTKCKMQEHIRTHNGKKPSCRCVHRAFNVHVRPPRGAPFACNLCKLVTCTRADLKRHLVKFHNMKSEVYKCHHCHTSFSQKDHLIIHLKLQSDDYTSHYKCSSAKYQFVKGFKYDYDTCLTKEERKFIDNYEIQSHPYECGLCPFKCTKKLHLKAHLSKYKAELAKQPYSCQYCNFKSTKERDLNQHLKNTHPLIKPYFCKLCDCTYSTVNELVRHIKYTHLVRKN